MNNNTPRTTQQLMRTLVEDGNRPGQGLPWMALLHTFGLTRNEDLALAVEDAEKRGWVTVTHRSFVLLTEEGYATRC
jgi:hypothetical protein